MAYADYAHCSNCDAKAFYDADIGDPHYLAMHGEGDYEPLDMAVLCWKCAQTHKCVVVPKDASRVGDVENRREAGR